ncbi:MAG: molecular chaperone TorD family protein [Chloroflexi bacterium]|uniref:TorD/DmsD family molecular chaperone n=1 Tax=Candidatus Flexifilum breve TaxID=3140694 RepID=UPI003135EC74|nr:molecular chaperone TorD family protein [Chloroflexota bacterium]
MQQDDLFADWPLESTNDALKTGLETLQAFFRGWQAEDFDAVRRDFARLFIGPGHLPTPPWESVYRNEERLIFDKQTLQVRLLFRQFGMVVPTVRHEPEESLWAGNAVRRASVSGGAEGIRTDQPYHTDIALAALDSFFGEHIGQWALPSSPMSRKRRRHPIIAV